MDKRTRVRGAIKVASCVNGKIVRSTFLACVLIFGATLPGCATIQDDYYEYFANSVEDGYIETGEHDFSY